MTFSDDDYRSLLAALGTNGRPVVPFGEAPPSGPVAILRHDVDFSLAQALRLAEIDATCGARASIFVMLSSRHYSPFSPESVAMLTRMVALGHEIGLHFDAGDYDDLPTDRARERVGREAALLAERIGAPVTSVAQHKPGNRFRRLAPEGFIDAYEPRFFSEIGYISDSRGIFREPDPIGFAHRHDRLQLLIHAEWWSPEGVSRRAALERVAEEGARRARHAVDAEVAHLGIEGES